jgi:hypothetical protein
VPALRRPLSLILLVVVVASAAYVVTRLKRDLVDFEVYRTAGVRALAAEPLYRPDDGHYQFKYWPAFALMMAPFALVNDEVAKILWYALSILLLMLFVQRSVGMLPDRRTTERAVTLWILLLTAKFIVKELVNGQTNLLLGVLALVALSAAERGRPIAAGAVVGAAAFVKPYALLLAPWLLGTVGVTALASTGVVVAAGLVLPAVVYGWSGNVTLLRRWYETVLETTPANLLFPENISFAAMWAKWLGAGQVASALALLSAACGLGIAVLLWSKRTGVSRPGFLEIGFLLLLVPLISPQGWDYVLLVAIPAFACLVDRFVGQTFAWRLVVSLGFVLTSFTIFDLLGRRFYASLMSASVVSVGALLLAAALVRLRLTRTL